MARRLTTETLIDEVRSLIDETNESNIDDERDILPALNRAQDYVAGILARRYEEPLLTNTTMTLVGGQDTYNIPEDALEGRIEKVEIFLNQFYSEVDRISYRDITDYESPISTNVPYYYAVIGRQFRMIPAPSGDKQIRVWYLKDPLPLVQQQGRITLVNESNNYVIVDSIGDDLTTNMDDLDSFVNVVDGENGRVKATLQIQSINDTRITFKTVPDRTTVLNQTVSSTLPTGDDVVTQDDFICTASGTCIPFFKKPIANFLITYAATDIKVNKLGGDPGLMTKQLTAMENQVERMWVGQEQTLRVKRVNKNFGSQSSKRRRRLFYNS
jgi:hypothetical protein